MTIIKEALKRARDRLFTPRGALIYFGTTYAAVVFLYKWVL